LSRDIFQRHDVSHRQPCIAPHARTGPGKLSSSRPDTGHASGSVGSG
jgi:hypothetical protein